MKIELKKIGNSTGVILPKEMLTQLGLAQGDTMFVSNLPDRSVRLSAYDPHHEEVMRIARKVMHDYRDALKELAK